MHFIGVYSLERCRLSQVSLERHRGKASPQEIEPDPILVADDSRHQAGSGSQLEKVPSRACPRYARP